MEDNSCRVISAARARAAPEQEMALQQREQRWEHAELLSVAKLQVCAVATSIHGGCTPACNILANDPHS